MYHCFDGVIQYNSYQNKIIESIYKLFPRYGMKSYRVKKKLNKKVWVKIKNSFSLLMRQSFWWNYENVKHNMVAHSFTHALSYFLFDRHFDKSCPHDQRRSKSSGQRCFVGVSGAKLCICTQGQNTLANIDISSINFLFRPLSSLFLTSKKPPEPPVQPHFCLHRYCMRANSPCLGPKKTS